MTENSSSDLSAKEKSVVKATTVITDNIRRS